MKIARPDARNVQLPAPDTLIEAAQLGYDNPNGSIRALMSSPIWFAFYAGQAAASVKLVRPTKAFMSRGYCVRIQSGRQEWFVSFDRDLTSTTIIAKATRH